MYTRAFWQAAFERAFATFLQALLAVMLVDGFDLYSVNWGDIFATAGIAAGISLIKSILAGLATGTPSMTKSEVPSGVVAAALKDGRFVAGEAAPMPNGTPVAVTSTYSGDTKSDATYHPGTGTAPGSGGGVTDGA